KGRVGGGGTRQLGKREQTARRERGTLSKECGKGGDLHSTNCFFFHALADLRVSSPSCARLCNGRFLVCCLVPVSAGSLFLLRPMGVCCKDL
ncbi:unnamed protein product, partial [Ectocarpus fasciculatus]